MPDRHPSDAHWWYVQAEPRILTLLACLAVSLPPLWVLDVITLAQFGHVALILAWLAALLLLLRLPMVLRAPRQRAIFLAVFAGGSLVATLALGTAPSPVTAQNGLSFVSPPRISQQAFVQILRNGGSPATSAGPELYDIIVAYGLDPAVALAFFKHESQFCTTGRCARDGLQNWGMLRRAVKASRGAGSVGGFARYGSWQDSVRDWCELILGRYVNRGLDTVEKAVPVYAPRSDGNVPESYINTIRRLVASWSGRRIEAEVQLHSYSGNLDTALISETFLSSEITYHPNWAFHTFMIEEAKAGRPLGAPLDDSRIITVNGKQFAVQVFALDTLYTPIADVEAETNWSDVRRLSDLLGNGAPTP
ncbi:MAG: glucosaminidase domain-containing protein [Oscillochloris sp.]|nr:glucosaminidase domain-containing protein [Oscillochloris sp.]